MAKSKQSKIAKKQETVQQPTPSSYDEDDEQDDESDVESDVEIEVGDGELEKDEAEEELERLVFGDSSGWREGLRDSAPGEGEEQEQDDGTTGLEGLDNAQVGQIALLQGRWQRF